MFTPQETIIHIDELATPAYVGLDAPERDELQSISISIDCALLDAAVAREDLSTSLDYAPLTEAVRILCVSRKRKLIETLAEEIAETCFSNPKVVRAHISIKKPEKLRGTKAVGITRTFLRA